METQLTINDYINQLFADKHSLVLKLQDNWIDEAVDSLTFTQLIPFIGTELTRIININDHANDVYSAASGFNYSTAINLGSYMINRYPAEIKVTSNVTNLNYFAAHLVGKVPKIITQGDAVTNFSNMYRASDYSDTIDCSALNMTNATNTNQMFGLIRADKNLAVNSFRIIGGPNTKLTLPVSFTATNWQNSASNSPFYRSFQNTSLVDLTGFNVGTELFFTFCGDASVKGSMFNTPDDATGQWTYLVGTDVFNSKKIILDTTNVTKMDRVFEAYNNYQWSGTSILDLSEWYTPNLTECINLFGSCKFSRIDIRNFDFTGCAGEISFCPGTYPSNVSSGIRYYNFYLNRGTVFIIKDESQREHLRTHLRRYADFTFYTVEEWEARNNG